MRRCISAIFVLSITAGICGAITSQRPAHAVLGARSDFNCDGYSDLAVGAPGETVGATATGIVQVFFGSDAGLAPGATTLSIGVGGTPGIAAAGDRFGHFIATGNLDDDTCADLVVSATGVDVGPTVDTGAVYIFYGSSSGFAMQRTDRITRGSAGVPGANQTAANFGYALAVGDANGDFAEDLAIGAPLDDVNGVTDVGSVTVINAPGNAGNTFSAQWFRQGTNNVVGLPTAGDRFGSALSFGNFVVQNVSDFSNELAIGVPGKELGTIANSGSVVMLQASASGLAGVGSVAITQSSAGVPGLDEAGDAFGSSLASGLLLGNDEHDDLAIGAPTEDVYAIADAGSVTVLGGSTSGLASGTSPLGVLISQGYGNMPDLAEAGDQFGLSLHAASFSATTSNSDLVIGAPRENVGAVVDAGMIMLVRNTNGSISASGAARIAQGLAGVPSVPETSDLFGLRLSSGDFRGLGANDLAIGVPLEDGAAGLADTGMITVLGSDGDAPTGSLAMALTQVTTGVPDVSETMDRFGCM